MPSIDNKKMTEEQEAEWKKTAREFKFELKPFSELAIEVEQELKVEVTVSFASIKYIIHQNYFALLCSFGVQSSMNSIEPVLILDGLVIS